MTCYLGLLSVDVYDLAGPRASGNVRHAEMLCYIIVGPVCVLAVEPCLTGLLSALDLGKNVKMVASTRSVLTLFEQSEDSLDQLLIKAITKACEKSCKCVAIDGVRLYESVSVCVA